MGLWVTLIKILKLWIVSVALLKMEELRNYDENDLKISAQ